MIRCSEAFSSHAVRGGVHLGFHTAQGSLRARPLPDFAKEVGRFPNRLGELDACGGALLDVKRLRGRFRVALNRG